MGLGDFFKGNKKGLSFELFPPKTDEGVIPLLKTVEELMGFGPDFFTCTYGAGGSTRDRTLQILERVKQQFSIPVASHLTCVGATVDQLRDYLNAAIEIGTDYIVALRGDPPKGETEFRQTDGGFRYANDLVGLIKSEYPQLGIAVAGYPEVHQEAPNLEVDLVNLKRKVDAGADIVVTQLFYKNDDYFRFVDRCQESASLFRSYLEFSQLPIWHRSRESPHSAKRVYQMHLSVDCKPTPMRIGSSRSGWNSRKHKLQSCFNEVSPACTSMC
jgi:methylenetetrahydrofolate reductase (NADPH)